MPGSRQSFVALLRGINVGGKNKIPMAELRAIAEEIGCEKVKSYIQSGNLVFESSSGPAALEAKLEEAIEQRFGFSVPVIVCSASNWAKYVESNPFPDESADTGNWVLLALSKRSPKTNAAKEIQKLANQGERAVRKGEAIWVHYANGIAKSKLTPAVLDRFAGSPVTARNWRTVLKLDDMLRANT